MEKIKKEMKILRPGFPVLIFIFLLFGTAAAGNIPDKSYRSFSPLPILMYDNDIGFGYGGKVKFVDYLKKKNRLT